MSDSRRSKWLLYKINHGILDTFLETGNDRDPFREFVSDSLNLADTKGENGFAILDSFLSDSISSAVIHKILAKSNEGEQSSPLKVLLANPYGDFGRSRARSIYGKAERAVLETATGINALLQATGCATIPAHASFLDFASRASKELAGKGTVSLRFFDEAPSGPMYFINDLVVCSRFGAYRSSTEFPWWSVADDANHPRDLYDSYREEFQELWKHATSDLKSPHLQRLSYEDEVDQGDATVVYVDIVEFTRGTTRSEQLGLFRSLQEAIGKNQHFFDVDPAKLFYLCTGDGGAVVFDDSLGAETPLMFAQQLRELLKSNDPPVRVRQGVFRGAVSIFTSLAGDRQCIGTAINMAARISEAAEPDQILFAAQIYETSLRDRESWRACCCKVKDPVHAKHGETLRVYELEGS